MAQPTVRSIGPRELQQLRRFGQGPVVDPMVDRDGHYIPGMPTNLQGVLHNPEHSLEQVKALRARHAGDPAMQQRLSVDDRYWQGREMTRENPVAGVGQLLGAVPYDAAKLAYFHGPKQLRPALEQLTEKLFPGEGFNPKTTSRPSLEQYRAQTHGMAEGAYQNVRDAVKALNRVIIPEKTAAPLRNAIQQVQQTPLTPGGMIKQMGTRQPEAWYFNNPKEARQLLHTELAKLMVGQAGDPIGGAVNVANNVIQTVFPDLDGREPSVRYFEPPVDNSLRRTAPMRSMTPAAKAKQNAEISRVMANWGK